MADDVKPRFFVSHDEGGLHLWLSQVQPGMDPKSHRFTCPEGNRMRLPYSWFGYMMRENSLVEVPVEDAIVKSVDNAYNKRRCAKST